MTDEGKKAVAKALRLYPVGVIADALAALQAEVRDLEAQYLELSESYEEVLADDRAARDILAEQAEEEKWL